MAAPASTPLGGPLFRPECPLVATTLATFIFNTTRRLHHSVSPENESPTFPFVDSIDLTLINFN
jgi:hypothetical protein